MLKKDPNHAKIERERRLAEDKQRRLENYLAKQKGDEEGDAFDRAGMGGGSAAERYTAREKESERCRREDAEQFVDEVLQPYPEIEVFSPLGKYIGCRMPMCGSVLGGPKPVSSRERTARPRRSMVSVKGQRRPMGRE